MKRLPLNKTDRILLGILLLGAVVVTLITQLLLPPARHGGWMQQRSTFVNEAYGTKAAYLVLEKLGCAVQRWRRPLAADALPADARLVLLAPVIVPTDDEAAALDAWVQAGGTLLLVPPERCTNCESRPAGLEEWFRTTPVKSIDTAEVSCADAGSNGTCERLRRISTDHDMRFADEDPLGGPLTDASAEVLLRDDAGILACRVKHGAGWIVALVDAHPLSNLELGRHDNALLLAHLLTQDGAALDAGPIYFDEYHQGYPYREATWQAIAGLMWHGRWGWTVVQVLLVCALGLWANGVRQGRARPSAAAPRRHHGEFAHHAAQLLHDGGDVAGVVRTLRRHYRTRAERALRLSPGTADSSFAQAVEAQAGGLHRLAVAQLCAADSPSIVRSKEVLPAVERWEQLLKELEHVG